MDYPLLLSFIAVFIILLLSWKLYLAKNRWRRLNKVRQKVAYGGEDAAAQLLEQGGFRIESRQARRKTGLFVNGTWVESEIRVDFLATREGEKCLIEVKTGSLAPLPTHPPTRRQLLEYAAVFPEREIYLLDMDKGLAHHIAFSWFN